MTALSADTNRDSTAIDVITATLASGFVAYKGGEAAINLATGKLQPVQAAGVGQLVIGHFLRKVDASGGDKVGCQVRLPNPIWCQRFAISGTVDATDLGKVLCFVDDNTVARSTAGATLAGRYWGTQGGLALIEVGAGVAGAKRKGATLAFASADIVVTAAQIFDGVVFDVPTSAANSTITLPVTDVPDNTVVYFRADGIKNGHTVQYRFGTTNITAAATASKIHLATCVKLGASWGAALGVAP